MKSFALVYPIVFVLFLGMDGLWLSLTANPLYRRELGSLLLADFKPAPALLFYCLYIFGLVFLAVAPQQGASAPQQIFLRGAVLGLVAYATYDLTNLATLKGWSTLVTCLDLAWGTLASALAAALGGMLAQRFGLI